MSVPHVVLINITDSGHLNPTLELASELRRRGGKVTVIFVSPGGPVSESTLERVRSDFGEPLEWSPKTKDMNFLPQDQRRGLSIPACLQWAGEVADSIRSLTPPAQAILYDPFASSAHVVAKLVGLPAISSCSWIPTGGGGQREMFWSVSDNMKCLAAIKEKYGVDVIQDALPEQAFIYHKELKLVYTLPECLEEGFQDSFVPVGALVAGARPKVEGFDLDGMVSAKNQGGGHPVVFVSLGTMVTGAKSKMMEPFQEEICRIFRTILEVASELLEVATFIVAVPGRDVEWAGSLGVPVPSNTTIFTFVPQLDVLAKLADVFITHGGCNSMNEALYYGVPMVVLPFFGDQMSNGQLVARLNCGVEFPVVETTHPTLSGEALGQSLKRLLGEDEGVRETSRGLREKMMAMPGVKGAVDIALQWLADWKP